MKKTILPILALSLLLTFPAHAAKTKDAASGRVGIAAIVNDDVVTIGDVASRLRLYLVGAPSAPPPDARKKIEQQVLVKLIDEKLQMQEAENLGIVVEEPELRDAFAQIAQQNNLPPEDFRKRLNISGVIVDTLMD